MASSPFRAVIQLAAIIVTAMTASAAMASAGDLKVVPPPKAYIDFCFREPDECPSVPTGAAPGDASGQAAAAEYWRLVFASGEPSSVSSPPADPAPRQGPNDTADLAVLSKVNLAINRSLAQNSDAALYRRSDYWALPLAHGVAQGDCEDFVLEKRRVLRAKGYTERQMSIAIVKTPWKENHAVLLVSTEGGEVVLDNLSPRIEPWSRSHYALLARQSASDPSTWLGVR